MNRFNQYFTRFFLVLILLILASSDWTRGTADHSTDARVEISEVMARNRAAFCTENHTFPDWVELHNIAGEPVDLGSWVLTDRADKQKLFLKSVLLEPDEYLVIPVPEAPEEIAAGDGFSISEGETVFLLDETGSVQSQMQCNGVEKDCSLVRMPDGSIRQSPYPTPGRENTKAAYDQWQSSAVRESPVLINEVVVADPDKIFEDLGDWIELVNLSEETVTLEDWTISDDWDNLTKAYLPKTELEPGAVEVFSCGELGIDEHSVRRKFRPDDRGKRHVLFLRGKPRHRERAWKTQSFRGTQTSGERRRIQ